MPLCSLLVDAFTPVIAQDVQPSEQLLFQKLIARLVRGDAVTDVTLPPAARGPAGKAPAMWGCEG